MKKNDVACTVLFACFFCVGGIEYSLVTESAMPAVISIFAFCICSFTSACMGRRVGAMWLYLLAVLLGLPVAAGCAVAGWQVYGWGMGLAMGAVALLLVLFLRGFCVFWMRMCRRLHIWIHRMK